MASTLALALARSVSFELELDIFALADIVDAAEAEPAQGMGDGAALGIEDAVLEGDVNLRLHALDSLYCSVSGPGHVARAALGQDAEAAGHFLVGLGDLAEVAAEAVLVQLLVGLDVPEPAIVRADLVGEHDAHVLAFSRAGRTRA